MNTTADFKPLTKKAAARLKPGDLVELKFNDSPNLLGILLHKPDASQRGDMDVEVFLVPDYQVYKGVHTQVIAHRGSIDSAKLFYCWKT